MNLSSFNCPDRMEEEEKLHISSRESSRVIFLQVLPSYLLAGLGMVTAGMLLDHVQVSDTQHSSVTPVTVCGLQQGRSKKQQKTHTNLITLISEFLLDYFQTFLTMKQLVTTGIQSYLQVRLHKLNKVTISVHPSPLCVSL